MRGDLASVGRPDVVERARNVARHHDKVGTSLVDRAKERVVNLGRGIMCDRSVRFDLDPMLTRFTFRECT